MFSGFWAVPLHTHLPPPTQEIKYNSPDKMKCSAPTVLFDLLKGEK